MSAEEVTVSLSRLALAKAIKTPDAGEDEAEPWSKSIIFHQAHIDSDMRNSIISPQQNRRRPGQRQQPLFHKNQKQQRGNYSPNMHHSRQDELYQQRQSRYNNLQQYPNQQQHPIQQQQQQQQQHISQLNPKTNGNKGYTNSTISKTAGTKPGRHIIPSDDEEDDEEEEEEEEEEDDDDENEEAPTVIKNTKNKSQNNTRVQARTMSEADSKYQVNVTQPSKVKGRNHRQQPSDDEDDDDDDDEDDEDDEYDKESTTDENENESDKDSLDNGHEATNALAAEENQKTYARRMSTLRQLEKGSGNPRRRSRSLSDMEQFTLPLAQIGEHDLSLGQLNAMDEWQKTIVDVENITGSSMSDLGSSAMTSNEGDVVEEPIVSTNTTPSPSFSQHKASYRMSTLGEMDFYQYQQQQQQQQQQIAFHNMQMQQAMQMAQIQQYQQAVQIQQQMMMNYDPRMANNRQSAMDVMLQMEQDKSASRKNKKKPINTSNVSLNDGLLGRVPEQRQHNISFQGQMMSNGKRTTMARASKSDHNLRESRNRNRPPSTMYYERAGSSMGMDPRMYSQMGRSENPMPMASMSTPLQPGQYLSPNRPRTRQSQQPMMAQSRSTGRASYMPSSRQSTNWGSKSKERIR